MSSDIRENKMTMITLYSAPWCPDCWRVKVFLRERGVPFHEVNIEEDEDGEETVLLANQG